MNSVTGLSLGRIAVGVLSFLQPAPRGEALRPRRREQPTGAYLARLFGSREVALGTATLLARGKTRRNLVLAGIGVDLADAATGVLGIQDQGGPVRTTGAIRIAPALGAKCWPGIGGLRQKA